MEIAYDQEYEREERRQPARIVDVPPDVLDYLARLYRNTSGLFRRAPSSDPSFAKEYGRQVGQVPVGTRIHGIIFACPSCYQVFLRRKESPPYGCTKQSCGETRMFYKIGWAAFEIVEGGAQLLEALSVGTAIYMGESW